MDIKNFAGGVIATVPGDTVVGETPVLERYLREFRPADESTYSNIPRLGWIVWNEVGPISQTFAEAQDILQSCGFDPVLLPRTTPKKAFILALGSVREIGGIAPVRVFSRPVTENSKVLRHQITVETAADGKGALKYDAKAIVDFMKEDEKISFRGDEGEEELKNAIMTAYQRFKDRVYHWNLGRFVVDDITRCDGVVVRPKGGVWFVPDVHTARVQAMEGVFEEFANGCRFYKHPVVDTTEWRNNVRRFAEKDMRQELRRLDAEFERFLEIYRNKEVETKSLQARINAYEFVWAKAGVYEHLLSFEATEIKRKVKETERKILEVMGGSGIVRPVEKKTRKP